MKTSRIIQWVARLLCIAAILFVSLFALDAFDPKLTIWQQIGGFLIHLLPSFVLMVFLLIAWKWPLAGGIILAAIGLLLSPVIFVHNYRMNGSIGMSMLIILSITVPFIIVGGLFIISHFLQRRESTVEG